MSTRPRLYTRSRTLLLVMALIASLNICFVLSAMAQDDLTQTVTSDEASDDASTVISRGHVDLGPRIVDGQWMVRARDDSGQKPVWRAPANTVLHVTDAALMDAPTDDMYNFMGASAGQRWYVVPQTENPQAVWLGWNTQDPAVTQTVDRGVTMRIGPIMGPGKSWLFLQNGTFGEPLLLVDGQVPQPQDVWVDVNTHVHANWVFTEPGIYLARVEFSATTRDGATLSDHTVLRFAVGDSTSTDEALVADTSPLLTAEAGNASSIDGASSDSSATDATNPAAQASPALGEPKNSLPTTALWIAIGVAIIAGVALVFVWQRNKRISAEREYAQQEAKAWATESRTAIATKRDSVSARKEISDTQDPNARKSSATAAAGECEPGTADANTRQSETATDE
ncbi:choice-of-anchor M domain-containing protein [Schaalia suimastitidis]|uniref:choice-of-anchor M domain-containing protein n=1 Tax=Schaalia suimastitidis TaxID=121163 RepID=UPI00041C46E5|nr:choice-of-anchor M domain-containing protein [Schaalia suimastitidis]